MHVAPRNLTQFRGAQHSVVSQKFTNAYIFSMKCTPITGIANSKESYLLVWRIL
jgi:hypothetical protein